MYCESNVSKLIYDMCEECYAFEQRLDLAVFTEKELRERLECSRRQIKEGNSKTYTLDEYMKSLEEV